MALDLISGLRPLLLTCDELAALVGTRIMPIELEQDSIMPALTYDEVGGSGEPTFETSGMRITRMAFYGYGKKASDAYAVRSALVNFLEGFVGTLQDGTRVSYAEYLQPLGRGFLENSRTYRAGAEFYLHHT